jgi:hypothetical protein
MLVDTNFFHSGSYDCTYCDFSGLHNSGNTIGIQIASFGLTAAFEFYNCIFDGCAVLSSFYDFDPNTSASVDAAGEELGEASVAGSTRTGGSPSTVGRAMNCWPHFQQRLTAPINSSPQWAQRTVIASLFLSRSLSTSAAEITLNLPAGQLLAHPQ